MSHLFIKIVSFLSILLLIWIHCPTSCHLDLSLKTYFSVNTYPSLTHSLSFFFFLSFFLSFFLFPRRCGKHVVTHVMNPKSMHRERLLGHMDIDTREWTDGVLTDAARKVVREPSETSCWIICDGDVDPEVRALHHKLLHFAII